MFVGQKNGKSPTPERSTKTYRQRLLSSKRAPRMQQDLELSDAQNHGARSISFSSHSEDIHWRILISYFLQEKYRCDQQESYLHDNQMDSSTVIAYMHLSNFSQAPVTYGMEGTNILSLARQLSCRYIWCIDAMRLPQYLNCVRESKKSVEGSPRAKARLHTFWHFFTVLQPTWCSETRLDTFWHFFLVLRPTLRVNICNVPMQFWHFGILPLHDLWL